MLYHALQLTTTTKYSHGTTMSNYLESDITSPSSTLNFGTTTSSSTNNNPQISLGHSNSIPTAIYNRKTQVLIGPILVQIVLVLDISRSKLSLLDAIKADRNFPVPPRSSGNDGVEEPLTTRNRRSTRRIIRLPPPMNETENDNGDGMGSQFGNGNQLQLQPPGGSSSSSVITPAASSSSNGLTTEFKTPYKSIHKVILQDSKGTLVYGIELQKLPFLSMTTPLGSKVCYYYYEF